MDVVQLLPHFRARVDVKIVIPPLPKSSQPLVLFGESQRELTGFPALSPAHSPRDSLLEHLHHFGRKNRPRFANQKVHVLRHDHVAYERKPVPCSNFVKDLHGKISRSNRSQQGPSLIATECDEMQVAAARDALQILRHRSEEAPTLCKLRKG